MLSELLCCAFCKLEFIGEKLVKKMVMFFLKKEPKTFYGASRQNFAQIVLCNRNYTTHNDFLAILARLHLSCLTYVSHLLCKTESENL